MENINYCIVEDDLSSQFLLKYYLEREPRLKLIDAFCNSKDAIELLNKKTIDLIFLDINLPDFDGFKLLEKISYKPYVIFITSNSDYAFKSFDFNVIDFLSKPISEHTLQRALNRLFEKKLNTNTNFESPYLESTKTIELKNGCKDLIIDENEIIYTESLGNYVKLFLKNECKTIKTTTKDLLNLLPKTKFIQIHKSYIININFVQEFSKNEVSINEKKIPIGICYKKHIENILPVFQKENL